MRSTPYSRMCKRIFGRFFKRLKVEEVERNHLLEKADIRMTYEEYYSRAIMNVLITSFASLVISILIHKILGSSLTALLIFLLPSISTLLLSSYYIYLPESRAKARAKEIDLLLPYVTNFIATMSSAGISPAEIFKKLSKVELYGEVQKEAKKIAKEIYIMGIDTITALKHAIERSPSRKFKDFIQGIISTIQSGSDLNLYFKNTVDRYMQEDLLERKKNLESLAIIAEIFVIAVIAFPLFLVIIIATMSLTSSGGGIPFSFIYILSFLILPLAYLGFYVMMKSTAVRA